MCGVAPGSGLRATGMRGAATPSEESPLGTASGRDPGNGDSGQRRSGMSGLELQGEFEGQGWGFWGARMGILGGKDRNWRGSLRGKDRSWNRVLRGKDGAGGEIWGGQDGS